MDSSLSRNNPHATQTLFFYSHLSFIPPSTPFPSLEGQADVLRVSVGVLEPAERESLQGTAVWGSVAEGVLSLGKDTSSNSQRSSFIHALSA